ncbi:hypothetical protein M9Y10_046089 [Tritrichomonas musculus]|uniref:Uncharacterized protein n=1 Tax=Tritrichomonas musculus TaxID=1915356 RepID=A0ABR2JX41_9EUKA
MSISNKEERAPHLIKIQNDEYHPLFYDWTFYYLIPNRMNSTNNDWNSYLKKLHDFSTFEDFWAILNSIEPSSKLQKGCRYYVFKKPIQPLWEDPGNTGGHEISIHYHFSQIKPDQKSIRTFQNSNNISNEIHNKAQEKWKKLIIAVLCNKDEYFHAKELINGIEFTCRANAIKVGIWTKPTTEEQFESLKNDLLNILEYNEKEEEFKTEVIAIEKEKDETRQINKKKDS